MAGWVGAAINIAQAAAPLVKSGLKYKPSKYEKAYRQSVEDQANQLNQGTAMGEGMRQQMLATAQGQSQAQAQSELAEVNRGSQGNVGASGQTQQARNAAYDRQTQGVQVAQSQINQADAAMMQQAYAQYQQGLQTAAAMEYARRQAAMGELEKMSPEAIQAAYASGSDLKGTQTTNIKGANDSVSVPAKAS